MVLGKVNTAHGDKYPEKSGYDNSYFATDIIRLLVGQYSAYSSQVHPVFVQHSDVIELPPPPVMRRRLRLVRNIVLAEASSSHGSSTGK